MKYYKVLSQYDNKARYRSNDNGQKIPDNTVSKKNIYFSFGARFKKEATL
jgi:hypothetical protein